MGVKFIKMNDDAQKLQDKALEEVYNQTEPDESEDVMDIDEQRGKLGLAHEQNLIDEQLGPEEIDSAKQEKINEEEEEEV